MKIEKPDFGNGYFMPLDLDLQSNVGLKIQETLFPWFEREVEPINKILAEGETVYNWTDSTSGNTYWGYKEGLYSNRSKALLINIQPIKRETAEDVLRDWVDCEAKAAVRCGPLSEGGELSKLLHRAKAVLEGK